MTTTRPAMPVRSTPRALPTSRVRRAPTPSAQDQSTSAAHADAAGAQDGFSNQPDSELLEAWPVVYCASDMFSPDVELVGNNTLGLQARRYPSSSTSVLQTIDGLSGCRPAIDSYVDARSLAFATLDNAGKAAFDANGTLDLGQFVYAWQCPDHANDTPSYSLQLGGAGDILPASAVQTTTGIQPAFWYPTLFANDQKPNCSYGIHSESLQIVATYRLNSQAAALPYAFLNPIFGVATSATATTTTATATATVTARPLVYSPVLTLHGGSPQAPLLYAQAASYAFSAAAALLFSAACVRRLFAGAPSTPAPQA